MAKDYKILTDPNARALAHAVQEYIELGWTTVGGHSVVEKHHQLQYAGMQHKNTTIRSEYSQTIIKE